MCRGEGQRGCRGTGRWGRKNTISEYGPKFRKFKCKRVTRGLRHDHAIDGLQMGAGARSGIGSFPESIETGPKAFHGFASESVARLASAFCCNRARHSACAGRRAKGPVLWRDGETSPANRLKGRGSMEPGPGGARSAHIAWLFPSRAPSSAGGGYGPPMPLILGTSSGHGAFLREPGSKAQKGLILPPGSGTNSIPESGGRGGARGRRGGGGGGGGLWMCVGGHRGGAQTTIPTTTP